MFKPRTLKTLSVLLGLFALLALPAAVWPSYLDSPIGLLVAVPYLSIYAFDMIGIPGLLQNNGACGWGWCAPSVFGWIFLSAAWLIITWLLAWGIANITHRDEIHAKQP
jgi:hypothetical protein